MKENLESVINQQNFDQLQNILASNQKDIQDLGIATLAYACRKFSDEEKTNKLLNILQRKGVDLNKQGKFQGDNFFPIEIVTLSDDTLFLELLLKQGAKANVDGHQLMLALSSKKMTKLLLENGANPNGNSSSSTPLYRAAEKGHLECVKLLLQYGANPKLTCDNTGLTPLQIAEKNKHEEIYKVLHQGLRDWEEKLKRESDLSLLNPNKSRGFKENLFAAFETKDESRILKILIELEKLYHIEKNLQDLGIDSPINIKELVDSEQEGEALIFFAVKMAKPFLLEKVLKLGANPNASGQYCSPLGKVMSLSMGHKQPIEYLQCIDLLLNAGADVNHPADNFTVLMTACISGRSELVAKFIKLGAKVDAVHDGFSALYCAVMSGNKECVDSILKAGANIQINPPGEFKILDLAQRRGYTDIITLLKKAIPSNSMKIDNENKEDIPEELLDPIDHEIMKDPITAGKCGHTFDKDSLKKWYDSPQPNHDQCPECRESLYPPSNWMPNIFARRLIDKYHTEQKAKSPQGSGQKIEFKK